MIEVNEGWAARATDICQAENFRIDVLLNHHRLRFTGMTDEEIERLAPKLELVRELAMRLAINMAKGTIKYPRDTWSVDDWLDAAVDDTADGLNYIMMLRGAIERERLVLTREAVLHGTLVEERVVGPQSCLECTSGCDEGCVRS